MTIVEALAAATAALNDAVTKVLGLYDAMVQIKASSAAQVTTIINNFLTKPPVTVVYVDPINGDDAKDGSTIALARKTLDAAISAMGSNATEIRLLADATLTRRGSLFAPLTINGIQQAANANGYIGYNRTISFLGTAVNSPGADGSTFSAGLMCAGPTVRTTNINFALPDVPSGQNFRGHFTALIATAFAMKSPTITVSSQQAAALFDAFGGQLTATIDPTFGAGATGHLFLGVGAGANPNTVWPYRSNVTSA